MDSMNSVIEDLTLKRLLISKGILSVEEWSEELERARTMMEGLLHLETTEEEASTIMARYVLTGEIPE